MQNSEFLIKDNHLQSRFRYYAFYILNSAFRSKG